MEFCIIKHAAVQLEEGSKKCKRKLSRITAQKRTTWYCQIVKVNNAEAGFVCRMNFYTFKACLRSAARRTVNCFFLPFFRLSFFFCCLTQPSYHKTELGRKEKRQLQIVNVESEKVFEGIPGEVFLYFWDWTGFWFDREQHVMIVNHRISECHWAVVTVESQSAN